MFARSSIIAATASLILSPQALGDASRALHDRAQLLALDARCGIAAPGARAALESGRLQARGALARAGVADDILDALEAHASQASLSTDCNADAIATEMERIASAYAAWSMMRSMEFPADHRVWIANRPYESETTAWLVRQQLGDDDSAQFGVALRDGEPGLAFVTSGEAAPRAVRLIIRDAALSPHRTSNSLTRLIAGDGADPLAYRAAPPAYSINHWASGRDDGAIAEALASGEPAAPIAFWFGEDTLAALAALDSREAIVIEVDVPASRYEVETQRLYIEVGDFAAAVAFVDAAAS